MQEDIGHLGSESPDDLILIFIKTYLISRHEIGVAFSALYFIKREGIRKHSGVLAEIDLWFL